MPSFADQLARLRVAAATGHLPADLGRWAVERLTERAELADRREVRDRLLCDAARLLLPEGSTWARAVALRTELLAVDRRSGTRGVARELVATALEVDPRTPRSTRQLHTILKSTRYPFQENPAESCA